MVRLEVRKKKKKKRGGSRDSLMRARHRASESPPGEPHTDSNGIPALGMPTLSNPLGAGFRYNPVGLRDLSSFRPFGDSRLLGGSRGAIIPREIEGRESEGERESESRVS